MRLYSPDAASIQGGTAVMASDSPTGTSIDVTPRREMPAPEIHQPSEPRTRQDGVKISKVDVAWELGLDEFPSKSIEKEAKEVRKKMESKYKDVPIVIGEKPEKKAPKKAPVQLGEPEKEQIPQENAYSEQNIGYDEEPEAEIQQDTRSSPARKQKQGADDYIRIGNKELPRSEWEKRYEALRNHEEKKTPTDERTQRWEQEFDESEKQHDIESRRNKFLDEAAQRYAPSQEEFDQALADGDVNAFGKFLAKVDEGVRQWVVSAIGPHLDRLNDQLTPITQQQQKVQQYNTENNFIRSEPSIGLHKDGIRTLRQTSIDLHNEHADIASILRHNPNSANSKYYWGRLNELEKNFHNVLLQTTKERLGPVQEREVTTKKRPPAPTGSIGGGNAPRAKSKQSSHFSELEAAGFF